MDNQAAMFTAQQMQYIKIQATRPSIGPSGDQSFQLVHHHNHKTNLVQEIEANFVLLYLYLIIIISMSFLNLFLSMVIHPHIS